MALVLSLYNQQFNTGKIMKKLLGLIIAATVLSTTSHIYSQSKENYYEERNPFLFDKRHGAIFMMNKSITNVAEGHQEVRSRNIFLEQKRHQ